MAEVKSYLVKEAEAVSGSKPFVSVAGIPVYSSEEYNKAIRERKLEQAVLEVDGKKHNRSSAKFNKDGSVASSRPRPMIMNDEMFYSNRIRFVQEETDKGEVTYLHLCDDYRACKEQNSGNVYTNNVPVKVISHKQNKKGEDIYTLEKEISVSVETFVNEFKELLSVKDMQTIAENLVVPQVKAAKRSKLNF